MRWRSKERRQMEYYSGLMVNKDMVKEVRLYDLSDTFINRYDDAFGRYYRGMRRLIVGEGIWHVGIALLSSVVNCVFFAMIAVLDCISSTSSSTWSCRAGLIWK